MYAYMPRAGALLAAALLFMGAAFAQEADPFDEAAFDQVAGTEASPSGSPAAASSAARIEYLVGGTVLVSAAATAPAGFEGYAATAGASGKLFGKVSVPDYGSLYMSYNVSQAFFAGLAGDGSAALAPPSDLQSPSYSLGELYYGFDIGKLLFVRLGKQLLAWGPSRIWTPVDFVNLQKADAFSSVDIRQGKPGLKLHAPLGKANAFLFADFSRLAPAGATRDPAEAVRLAGRLDATLGGFELGITGFVAAEAQAKGGLDFSGSLFGHSVYGELALAPAYSGYSSSLLASLGVSRSLGELKRWTISAEGMYSSEGRDYSASELALGLQPGSPTPLTPLYLGRAYAYAAVSAKELFSPDLSTTLSALANLSDLSYTIRLAEELSLPRAVPLTLTLAYAGGGEGKEFTLLGGDGALSASLQTRIEF
jgi:hypothetical protein